jgi:hypothetical protein
MSEFKSFGKILNIGKLFMNITQKLHGSNAQIYIYKDEGGDLQLKTGSRTRWISPENDNYGFSQFVYSNKDEFIEKLGEGRHFGEWAGPGINSGEGLTEKKLFLFNFHRWIEAPLPSGVSTVPPLYTGKFSMEMIDETMEKLKINGSYLVPGYMKPEGIVIEVGDNFYKKTFENEEVAWKVTEKKSQNRDHIAVDHLLQPLRLEKLLSKDSRYLTNYPESLTTICSDYVKDLEEENQITGNEDEVKGIKKSLGRIIFPFVKTIVSAKL